MRFFFVLFLFCFPALVDLVGVATEGVWGGSCEGVADDASFVSSIDNAENKNDVSDSNSNDL